MISRWNAKADSASALIMWLVTVTAAIILGYWILTTTRPVHIEIKNIDNELETLQQSLSTACGLEYYRWKYNPRLTKGNVMIRNSRVCIDNQHCRAFYYHKEEPDIVDGNLVTNLTNVCQDPRQCSEIYFYSDEEMQMNGSQIIIQDVVECEPSDRIIRCLPLVCDTGTFIDINLRDVIYVEIKHENGTFNINRSLLG
jgi:hypothetical protein